MAIAQAVSKKTLCFSAFLVLSLVGCGKDKSKQIRIAPAVDTLTTQTSAPTPTKPNQSSTIASAPKQEQTQVTQPPQERREEEKKPGRPTTPDVSGDKPNPPVPPVATEPKVEPKPDTKTNPDQDKDKDKTVTQQPTPPQAADQRGFKWVKLGIPGAKCGNGDEYVIFIDQRALEQDANGRSRKMLLIFQGGGACWDEESCFTEKLTRLNPPDKVVASDEFAREPEAMFSSDPKINAFTSYSKIFFPYCTGDVFLGKHETEYGGKKVFHHGRLNIEATLQYLQNNNFLFNFQNTEDVVLFGFSAGAIGALYHLNAFADSFKWAARKALISDAPGLHFGPTFWQRFPDGYINDAADALAKFNQPIDRDSGLLSTLIPKVCRQFPQWNVGVLQATHDFVMSDVFGKITGEEHAKLMMGPYGVPALTADPNDNCSSWSEVNGGNHTFLVLNAPSQGKIGGVSAMEYAWQLAQGKVLPNYAGSLQGVTPSSAPAKMLLSFLQPVGNQQLRQR